MSVSELDEVVDSTGVGVDNLVADLMECDGVSQVAEADAADAAVESSIAGEMAKEFLIHATEDSRREGILFFDVETVPNETRYPRPKMPEPVVLGKDLTDVLSNPKHTVGQIEELLRRNPVKEDIDAIEAAERSGKNRKGVLDAIALARTGGNPEFVEWTKYSLHPLRCRIVTLGWAVGKHPVRSIVATNDEEERLLLRAWWMLIADPERQHCGFNTLDFDLGVLCFRSLILGVNPTRSLNRSKWGSNREAIDLYQKLFPFGAPSGGGGDCKSICRSLGIEIPAGDMDGSQVLGLWDAQDFAGIGRYVESDVTIERELFYRTANVFV